jgi:hypothetical protein
MWTGFDRLDSTPLVGAGRDFHRRRPPQFIYTKSGEDEDRDARRCDPECPRPRRARSRRKAGAHRASCKARIRAFFRSHRRSVATSCAAAKATPSWRQETIAAVVTATFLLK